MRNAFIQVSLACIQNRVSGLQCFCLRYAAHFIIRSFARDGLPHTPMSRLARNERAGHALIIADRSTSPILEWVVNGR